MSDGWDFYKPCRLCRDSGEKVAANLCRECYDEFVMVLRSDDELREQLQIEIKATE